MYKIDIIGNGRVTLALLKSIFDNKLDNEIEQIRVWSRVKKEIVKGELIRKEDNTNEYLVKIHAMFNNVNSSFKENKVVFRTFNNINELVEINNSDENHILILAIRYNLDELFYLDGKSLDFDLENPLHVELLKLRLEQFISESNISKSMNRTELKTKIKQNLNRIEIERKAIDSAIKLLACNTSVGYERLYNLKHSAIGIKNLAKVLSKNGGFKGTILNFVNEVDTTNFLLSTFSSLKPKKIISPCENDTIRAKFFLKEYLIELGIDVDYISLFYIGPHNHNGFAPKELIKVNGLPLNELISKEKLSIALSGFIEKVNSFGEKIYFKKGSSDEDTVIGIVIALKALLNNNEEIFRASFHFEEEGMFTGFPGTISSGIFKPYKKLFSMLNEESSMRFKIINQEQKLINKIISEAVGVGIGSEKYELNTDRLYNYSNYY